MTLDLTAEYLLEWEEFNSIYLTIRINNNDSLI